MQCSSGFECNARVFPLVAERKVPTGSSAMLAFFFCRGMQSSSRLKCNARFLCKECNVPPDSSATLVFSYRTGMQCSSRFECNARVFVPYRNAMFLQIRVQRSCFRTVHECNVPPRFGCNARVFVAYRNAMFLQIRVRCSFFCNGMHGSAGFECNARFWCKGCNVPPDSSAMLVVLHEKRDFLGCVHPFRVILVPVAAHGPLQFERFFFLHTVLDSPPAMASLCTCRAHPWKKIRGRNFYKIGEKSEKCKQTLFL